MHPYFLTVDFMKELVTSAAVKPDRHVGMSESLHILRDASDTAAHSSYGVFVARYEVNGQCERQICQPFSVGKSIKAFEERLVGSARQCKTAPGVADIAGNFPHIPAQPVKGCAHRKEKAVVGLKNQSK